MLWSYARLCKTDHFTQLGERQSSMGLVSNVSSWLQVLLCLVTSFHWTFSFYVTFETEQTPNIRIEGSQEPTSAAPPARRRRVQDLGDHAAHALEQIRTCLFTNRKKNIKKQCENRIVRELDSMMIINVMIFSHVFPIWFSEIARSDFSLGSRWSRADLSVPQQPFLQVNSTAAIHVHAWWSIHHDSQSWCHLMST